MDKQLVIQGNPIVLDLSLLGGGKVVISNNTNDNKVFLEGFSSDGNGSAAEMLITGRNATPLPVFVVRADTTFISGRELRFDLSPNGGGQLAIGNNPNDNKIFIEGLSRDGTGNADELFITGNSAQPLPFFSVIADTASFSGDVHAKGQVLNHHADCAEDFDICDTEHIEPGMVMVLGEDGKLHQSQTAYDKRVAGVVSGAGEYKPGIVLDRKSSQSDRQPIALLGKVFCKVDAQYGAIGIGDLLTTAPTPGHAMKAGDPFKAFGAVIGKALRAWADGEGLIPILIALQ